MTEAAAQMWSLMTSLERGERSLGQVLEMHPVVLKRMLENVQRLLQYGKQDEAQQIIEDLAQVESKSAQVAYALGLFHLQTGSDKAALQAFEEANFRLQGAPEQALLVPEELHLLRAALFVKMEEPQMALQALQGVEQTPQVERWQELLAGCV